MLESVPSLVQMILNNENVDLPKLALPIADRRSHVNGAHTPMAKALSPYSRLINAYGPAECSDDVALYQVAPIHSTQERAYLPIGRASDNNRLYILDADLNPVPVGVIGELCVAGVGVWARLSWSGWPDG